MRLRSVEDLLRDERKLLNEVELLRAAIEAADRMRVAGSVLHTPDGRWYVTEEGKAYDTARSALPDRDGPE